MINNKLIGDWATPKPASERTSLSPNFSGYGMKGRNSKSGLNIGKFLQSTCLKKNDQ